MAYIVTKKVNGESRRECFGPFKRLWVARFFFLVTF